MSGFLGVYLEFAALKVFEAEADFREFQASEVRGKSGERRGGNEQIPFPHVRGSFAAPDPPSPTDILRSLAHEER